jgi:hypothetical protein
MGSRAGLDDVEKRKFFTLPGLKLRPLGRPTRSQSLCLLDDPGSYITNICTVYIIRTYINTYIYPHTYVYMGLHTQYIQTYIYTSINVHSNIHTYIHTNKHRYIICGAYISHVSFSVTVIIRFLRLVMQLQSFGVVQLLELCFSFLQ